jgi:hypothetical protein
VLAWMVLLGNVLGMNHFLWLIPRLLVGLTDVPSFLREGLALTCWCWLVVSRAWFRVPKYNVAPRVGTQALRRRLLSRPRADAFPAACIRVHLWSH